MHRPAIDILLVEDNPGDVFLIRGALELGLLPKRVHAVSDGEEALDYLDQRGAYQAAAQPDLILLDLNLPKINGLAVLEIIKENKRLRHIPVLVLSTSMAERDINACYEHHANCYLTKPRELDEFLDLVQQVESYWLQCVELPAR